MQIGIIGSGWLAQAMARAWQATDNVTITTRDPVKQQQLTEQGFNCMTYNLGEPLPMLSMIEYLVLTTTSKDLASHQQLLSQLNHYPNLMPLFTSSTSVYPNDGKTHTEDSDNILTDQPLFSIEQCLQQQQGTTVIRCGGLIGTGRHPGHFFRNKAISSPQAPVNLLPLVDAVGIFKYVIEQNLRGLTINACHSDHPMKGDYYPKMAKSIGLKPAALDNQQSQPGKTVSSDYLISDLGYQMQGNIWAITE